MSTKKMQTIYLTPDGLARIKFLMAVLLSKDKRPTISQVIEEALACMVEQEAKLVKPKEKK